MADRVAANSSAITADRAHFYDDTAPPMLLEAAILNIKKRLEHIRLVDVGCGDGTLLYKLVRTRLIHTEDDQTIGLDASAARLKVVKRQLGVAAIAGDAMRLPFGDRQMFDVITCTQVIEHVSDDREMLRSLYTLLNADGHLYLSTVLKRRYAIYVYRNGGAFRLDPTHVREYRSEQEIVDIIQQAGFRVVSTKIMHFVFPVTDLLIRFLLRFKLWQQDYAGDIYLRHGWLRWLRRLRVPIVGYHCIEVLAAR